MNDYDIRRMIKREVAIQLQVISSGTAGDNSPLSTEDINELFPGLPALQARPIMRPYGLMSRAPDGTISVTAQQGSHPGNKMTLGHRDANLPPLDAGETKVYSLNGFTVYLSKTAVAIGKGGNFQTAVLGEALVSVLSTLINAIVAHTHMYDDAGNPNETQPPKNASDFSSIQLNPILAKEGGGL